MQIRTLIIFIAFLLCFEINAKAQLVPNYDSVYKKADNAFISGQYDTCIKTLKTPLLVKYKNDTLRKANKYTPEDKESFRELLIKSYLEKDEIDSADFETKTLLKRNTDYKCRSYEDEDFKNQINNFNLWPLLTIGGRIAWGHQFFTNIRAYSVLEGLNNKSYKTELSYTKFSGWAEIGSWCFHTKRGFKHNFSLNAEICYSPLHYEREFDQNIKDYHLYLKYTNELRKIEVPIYAKWNCHLGKRTLIYPFLGVSFIQFKQPKGNINIIIKEPDKAIFSASDVIDSFGAVKQKRVDILAGFGIGIKLAPQWRLNVDVRYYCPINSFNDRSKRYDEEVLILKYYYIDNWVKLHQIEMGVSISWTWNLVKKKRNI